MTAFLARWLLDPRVLGALVVAGALWLGWVHYQSLKEDLAATRTALWETVAERDRALDLADANRAAFEREQEARRNAVAALEEVHEELAALRDAARADDADIIAAPEDADGPVAPVLGDFLQRRFGG